MNFKPGDVVVFAPWQSPPKVVMQVLEDDYYICQWFNGAVLHYGIYHQSGLTLYEDKHQSLDEGLRTMRQATSRFSHESRFERCELRDLWAGADSEASECCLHRPEVSQSVSAG